MADAGAAGAGVGPVGAGNAARGGEQRPSSSGGAAGPSSNGPSSSGRAAAPRAGGEKRPAPARDGRGGEKQPRPDGRPVGKEDSRSGAKRPAAAAVAKARPPRAADKVKAGPKRWHTEGDFRVELKMQHSFPTAHLGPALLRLPSSLELLTRHSACSLDSPANWALHCEPGLGVQIDLIAASEAKGAAAVPLADEDAALLARLDGPRADADAAGRKERPATASAVWLKNTVYLSNNLHESVHAFKSTAKEHAAAFQELTEAARARAQRDVGERLAAVARSFSSAQRGGDVAALRHPGNPALRCEASMPLLPDVALWANNYVHVTLDREPAGSRSGSANALVSKVVATTHKRRGQPVLSASLSLPAPSGPGRSEDYVWSSQYQLSFNESTTVADRLVLFVDSAAGSATYTRETSKRVELELPRPTQAARDDAATPVPADWDGRTRAAFEAPAGRAVGLTPDERNAYRAKRRAVANDASEDEDDD
ncbi:Paf1-domain-containing protein [Pelagophyceae sp. CCMP2097]|nr:Paf1-domain-containing protein [Pelagophyceae sp. CCMP2097]